MGKIKNLAIGLVIILGAWFFLFNRSGSLGIYQTVIPEDAAEKQLTLVIDKGGNDVQSFQAEFKQGITAFELLQNVSSQHDLNLKTQQYDIGIFIEAVGNTENGQNDKYWMYYVNGEMPMVSADNLELTAGDKVEFKFEKSQF